MFSVKLFPSAIPLSLCNRMVGRRSPAATFSDGTLKSSSLFFLPSIPECDDEQERWLNGQPPANDTDGPKIPKRRVSLET
jgi:hypothetical protein